jgi:hypothetical protein
MVPHVLKEYVEPSYSRKEQSKKYRKVTHSVKTVGALSAPV